MSYEAMSREQIEQVARWRNPEKVRAEITTRQVLALTETLIRADEAIKKGERLLAAGSLQTQICLPRRDSS